MTTADFEQEHYPESYLIATRRQFLLENRPNAFKRMAKKGELDDAVLASVRSCQDSARTLIGVGWAPSHAWYHATCSVLCETEVD